MISGKILGPDANMGVPGAHLPAPGTRQSVTFVSLQPGQEQSLQTIFVRHNPDSQNRWQFSEDYWTSGRKKLKSTIFSSELGSLWTELRPVLSTVKEVNKTNGYQPFTARLNT